MMRGLSLFIIVKNDLSDYNFKNNYFLKFIIMIIKMTIINSFPPSEVPDAYSKIRREARFQEILSSTPPLRLTRMGDEVDRESGNRSTFKVLSQGELETRKIQVIQGRCCDSFGKPLNAIWSEMIWVLQKEGEIYAGFPKRGVIHHSSLTGKDWPIATGTLQASFGIIQRATEYSGHFCPKDRLPLFQESLALKGYDWDAHPCVLVPSPYPSVGDDFRIKD